MSQLCRPAISLSLAILFLSSWLEVNCTLEASPRVNLTTGCVEGLVKTTVLGRDYYSFQGIPYAAPPVGDLRFKAPQPPLPWSGVLKAAEEPRACIQHHKQYPYPVYYSEDCLYLNVFTPYLKHPSSKSMPVIVWIHGGMYFQSSSSTYKYRPDFFFMKDIVLVNINYRLGIFGFLNMNVSEAQGNASLKDRIAALRWVQKEISKFGGDPNRVTIMGGSSGASDVSHLYISPMAKGLFHRAISQSGSTLAYSSFLPSTISFALQVADSLGCPIDSPLHVVQCLKDINASVLAEQQMIVGGMKGVTLPFLPTIESDLGEEVFFPDSPRKLISQSGEVPYMIGFNNAEGLMYVHDVPVEDLQNINSSIISYLPVHMTENTTKEALEEMASQLVECYFQKNTSIFDPIYGFIGFSTDRTFGFSILKTVEALSARAPVYLYYFTFEGDFLANHSYGSLKLSGVGHGDELSYLFYRNYTIPAHNNFSSYPRSMEMVRKVIELWTNFAAYGNPTPTLDYTMGTKWEPAKPSVNSYFVIGETFEMVNDSLLKNNEVVWENLYSILLNQEYSSKEKEDSILVPMVVGLVAIFSVVLAISYYIQYRRDRSSYSEL